MEIRTAIVTDDLALRMNTAASSLDVSFLSRLRSAAGALQRAKAGEIAWEPMSDRRVAAELPTAIDLERLVRTNAVKVVKAGRHRTVYLVQLSSGSFYLKRYRPGDWYTRLKARVRRPVAYLEWSNLLRAKSRGIATVEPVALGRCDSGPQRGETYLVTKAMRNAIPLDEVVREQRLPESVTSEPRHRQALAVALGRLAGRVHAAGLYHRDLHAGNLLVHVEGGELSLRLVDLHPVRWLRRLSMRRIETNLASLHHFLLQYSRPSDRLRCFVAYWQELHAIPLPDDRSPLRNAAPVCPVADYRQAYRSLTKSCLARAEHAWRRRDRKWARGGRRITVLNAAGATYRGLSRCGERLHYSLLENPEQLFQPPLVIQWLKPLGKRRSAFVTLPGSSIDGPSDTQYHYKSLTMARGAEAFKRVIRRSACRAGWEVGHAFLRRGIATPLPLACVEVADGGVYRQYLLTERIPDAIPLSAYFQRLLRDMPEADRRDWLRSGAFRMALMLRRMHDSGFDHRDLKANNILIDLREGRPRPHLIDLESVRRRRMLTFRRRARNLARLNVSSLRSTVISPSQRLRFLKTYLSPQELSHWKRWWRAIERHSSTILQRNRRRGRPVPT